MRSMTLLLAALLLALTGCGGGGSDEAGDAGGKLAVVATTMQVGDLVRVVGGDHVDLAVLMSPGLDPHQYKASAGDVERLTGADLVVYNGLHLEAKMGEVLERLGSRKPTLAAAEAVPEDELIATDGAHDPHVWFDVARWRLALDAVAARLAELDPDHADAYRTNAEAHRAELTELHQWCRTMVSRIPPRQRLLITAHDAFNYLGRAYGLQVRGLQGISTATEAGTADVQALAELIAERRIPAIFVETSVSPRAIEAVQEAVRSRGHEVAVGGEVFSDAMGDAGTPEGTYVGMVRHNIATIVTSLGGEVSP
ncbi:manganese transporter [bacterium]|nr:manganese transporter [bacterium]